MTIYSRTVIFSLLLVFCAMTIVDAGAAQLFVDTDHAAANDSNAGSESSPWKTIQKATRTAQAGDTVWVKKGTYKGEVRIESSGLPAAAKDQADRLIVFSAYPGDEGAVVLDGSRILLHEASYVKVSGFRVQNTNSEGIAVRGICDKVYISDNHTYDTFGSGISVWGVDWGQDPNDYGYDIIHDIVIENNKVEKACNGGWNECITLANGVNGFQIKNNEVFNGGDPVNGGEGIDVKEGCYNGSITGNVIHGLTRRGIYLDGGGHQPWDTPPVHNIHIAYNRVYSNPNGQGMAIMTEGSADVHDIFIYNNLFYDNFEDGIMFYDHPNGEGDIYDITVVNNTCYDNKRFGILLNFADATNMIFRNNLCYKNGNRNLYFQNGQYEESHNMTQNPLFVDAADGDFHLMPDSPAIDAGSSQNAATDDFEGNSRPCGAAYDIGAYEFGCGTRVETFRSKSRLNEGYLGATVKLFPNYPNPFNPVTNLGIEINDQCDVSLNIVDTQGRFVEEIFSGRLERGRHTYRWDASAYAGGIYFVTLKATDTMGHVYTSSAKLLYQN